MGRYLLDTHTAIWQFNGDTALSNTAKQIIYGYSNRIYISIVSVWEVAIKINIGKLNFAGNTENFLHLADLDDITIFPIKTEHLLIYENLPLIHRDPFDRLLIATAIAEEMTLITDDKEVAKYGVPQVW
jgi:PIN domain nuclease of toxin-antitoxin system